MKFIEYADKTVLARALAAALTAEISDVLEQRSRAFFVVPGGTTPGPVFDFLSQTDLDWARVEICLSDERWVPEDSPRSNTRLLRERLLVGAAKDATLVSLYDGSDQPEAALENLGTQVDAHLPADVLLLGMGGDMHTASLFPGADGLAAALSPDASTLVAMHPEDQEEPRISFSARVLNSASKKHLMITGDEKRSALERAQNLEPMQAPIAAVLKDMIVHWTP